MAQAPRHDPIAIGDVATPPFARLPDPNTIFANRAERFRALADGHHLKAYLLFLADVCEVQHSIQDGLPPGDLPAGDAIDRARDFGMPPLDRNRFTADVASEATLDRLFAGIAQRDLTPTAQQALRNARVADAAQRAEMIRSVLADSIPVETLAEHVLVAAGLQVHFVRLAAQLDAKRLVPVGDGACPSCGGPPASSLVVGWKEAHGTRFCACALCGTLWNYVRIKCTVCASTKGISYQQIEGGPDTIRAEECSECHTYVKILYQQNDPSLDPIADDVASLGLDLLVREGGFRRAGVNPFLIGY